MANIVLHNKTVISQQGFEEPVITPNVIFPSGHVVSNIMIRHGEQLSVPGAGTLKLFGGDFEKKRHDTDIFATCTVFGAYYYSGNCGVGLCLNGQWDYGVAYQYDGQWTRDDQTTIIVGSCLWSNVQKGNCRIDFGWNSRTGSGERPFGYLNPNHERDGRNQQMISSIIVYEVMP
ncbi:MAG: hypothetical protein VW270_00210 [Candidatus Poseidoniales archaeon]